MAVVDAIPPAPAPTDAPTLANSWLTGLQAAMLDGDVEALEEQLLPGGWWRDLLCFSWDFRSLAGRDGLRKFMSENSRLATAGVHSVIVDTSTSFGQPFFYPVPGAPEGVNGVQLCFSFKITSPPASGRGLARLMQDQADGTWRAFTVFTSMEDLAGHEEPVGCSSDVLSDKTWEQTQRDRVSRVESNPTVLIVGGAQNGLVTAARLGQMGIDALVVEREHRVGDTWRKRYPSLKLHTFSNILTFLYEQLPRNFPKYMPKDKFADVLEAYVKSQNLVVWTSSTVLSNPAPQYDPETRQWTVRIVREGRLTVVRPKHIIMATGYAGEPRIPIVPGQDRFKGIVCHSTHFPGGHFFQNSKVVVIGASQSSADICQDLVAHGAGDVTMVQRSATCVTSLSLVERNVYSLWSYDRPIEDSDFAISSMPQGLLCILAAAGGTAMDKIADEEMHQGLRDAGFKLSWGEEYGMGEIGMFGVLLHRFGGYWLDRGCADLISRGRVAVKQGVEVERIERDAVVFEDGTSVQADAIIYATGYTSLRDMAGSIFGRDVIAKTTEVWGLDAEGETRGMYRPSGHPGFWYAVGGVNHARVYSKHLALQILGRELGLVRD